MIKPFWKAVWVSSKVKHRITTWSSNSIIYTRKLKTYFHTKTCTQMLIALFIIVKKLNFIWVGNKMFKWVNVFSYVRVLFGHKREWCINTYYNINKSSTHYAMKEARHKRQCVVGLYLCTISRISSRDRK